MTEGAREQSRGVDGVSARVAAWLAWSLCAASRSWCWPLLLVLLAWSTPRPRGWIAWQAQALYAVGPIGAFPFVGALIASRRPENPIGWIWLGPSLGLVSAVRRRFTLPTASGGVTGTSLALRSVVAWLAGLAVGSCRGAICHLPVSAFPRREAPLQAVAASGVVLGTLIAELSLGFGLAPGPDQRSLTARVAQPVGRRGTPLAMDASNVVIPALAT